MRTLDEAINHYEWCALQSLGECSDEARQMADWLRELKRLHDIDIEKNGFESMLQRQAETIFGMRYIIERMLPILKAPYFDCYACPVEERCDVEHNSKCLLVEWARDMGIGVE